MRNFFLLIISIFFSIASISAQTDSAGKYFTVIYKTGKNWDASKPPNQQTYFKEHSQFLADLRKQNVIKAGARYSDIGMLIIKSKNIGDAEALFRSDLAVINELFNVTVFEANFFYKGCID